MKALTIAANVLRRLFRDRTFLLMALIVPFALVPILGSASPTPSVGIVVEDEGALGAELASALHEVDDLDTTELSRDELLDQLRRGEVFAGVAIPAGYSQSLAAGVPVQIEYLALPDSLGFESIGLVEAVVAAQAVQVHAAQVAIAQVGGAFEDGLTAAAEYSDSSEAIGVRTVGVDGAALTGGLSMYTYIAATWMLLFVFITALATSGYIVDMRQLRLGERMLSTPTSSASIIGGSTLGRFAVGFIQASVIVTATALVYGVHWGNLAATFSVLALFVLAGTGAGVLLGSAFRNASTAMNLGIFIGIAFGLIGGIIAASSMPPLDVLTPHYWAWEALGPVLAEAATIPDILTELGMLAVLAAAYVLLAVWRFRRTIVP